MYFLFNITTTTIIIVFLQTPCKFIFFVFVWPKLFCKNTKDCKRQTTTAKWSVVKKSANRVCQISSWLQRGKESPILHHQGTLHYAGAPTNYCCLHCLSPSTTATISLCTLSSKQTKASQHCALKQLRIERLSCHAEGNGHVPLDCMINHSLVFACFLFLLTHSASNFVPVSLFLGDTLVCCFLKTMVKLNNLQLLQ